MKKLFTVLTALVLLCACLPLSVSAETSGTYGKLTYEIELGKVIITDCDENATGKIEVPAEIDGYPVTSIYIGAFQDCKYLSDVVLPDSIVSIGMSAFADCDNLSSVVIPEGVTSIDMWAFRSCEKLTSVSLPDSVNYIGDSAFYYCTSLRNIHFPNKPLRICSDVLSGTPYYQDSSNWDNGVLYLGPHLLDAKTYLSDTYIVKTGTLSIASEAFADCSRLVEVAIPDGPTSLMYATFTKCTSLTKVVLPDSITFFGRQIFKGCTSLASIQLPKNLCEMQDNVFLDTALYNNESNWQDGVLYVGNYLIEAKNEITGDYTVAEGTTVIAESAFQGCEFLTAVTIPESVATIGSSAFNDCTALADITIPDCAVDIGSYAFYDTAYYGDDSHWVDDVFYVGNHLVEGEVGGTYTVREGTVTIAPYAFISKYIDSRGLLENVTIPASVIYIGESAFYGHNNLTDVYYDGTREQWEQICILEDNRPLEKADIHFADDDSDSNKEDRQNRDEYEKNTDFPWIWVAVGGGVAVIAVLLILLLKKKKSA